MQHVCDHMGSMEKSQEQSSSFAKDEREKEGCGRKSRNSGSVKSKFNLTAMNILKG